MVTGRQLIGGTKIKISPKSYNFNNNQVTQVTFPNCDTQRHILIHLFIKLPSDFNVAAGQNKTVTSFSF